LLLTCLEPTFTQDLSNIPLVC